MSAADSDAAYGECLYDLFNDRADHRRDAEDLRALVMTHRPQATTWLDVACGTGHHLAALARWFRVAGLDISPSMLASARRHVGAEVPLHEGDFLDFDLHRAFDVVSCLSSSICHTETSAGLQRAILRVGAHVQVHVSRRSAAGAELCVHYVLATPGNIEHHELSFRVGLFTDEDYADAFDRAGFNHRRLVVDVLMQRGLHIASRSPLSNVA